MFVNYSSEINASYADSRSLRLWESRDQSELATLLRFSKISRYMPELLYFPFERLSLTFMYFHKQFRFPPQPSLSHFRTHEQNIWMAKSPLHHHHIEIPMHPPLCHTPCIRLKRLNIQQQHATKSVLFGFYTDMINNTGITHSNLRWQYVQLARKLPRIRKISEHE